MPPTRNARGGINRVSARELAGTRQAGSTGVRGVETLPTPAVTTPKTDIPVAAVENKTTPVQLPQTQLDPTTAINTAVTGSEAITTKMVSDAEAQKKAAETQQSATDARIKELFGLQGQMPAKQQELERQAGLEDKQRLANQIKAKADLLSQQRELFNIDTENQTVSNMLNASSRDITKRSFSAMDTRNRLERALESNAKASELIGLNAQFQIASGDVKLAQDSVKLALDTYYKPIEQELEMQKMFFQRNENRMTEAQRSLADARKTQIDRQFKAIDDAKEATNLAVASGYADNADIETLTNLSGNPSAQLQYAQKIVAEAARAEIAKSYSVKEGSVVSSASGEIVTVPSFEEWLDTKQQEAMMTFTPATIEKMREQYDSELEVMSQANRVSQLSPLAQDVLKDPRAYYDLTPTEKGKIRTELRANGFATEEVIAGKKKPLPMTQVDNTIQAIGVKSDVEKLNNMLSSLPGTGPIAGRLQGLNPYDPKRVAIEAQITRIIPSLARGIFLEVGVLTNEDVQRYRDTLANPNMTAEQINLIHQDTLRKINQTIDTTIEMYGSLGYDVGALGGRQTPASNTSLNDDQAYAEYLTLISNQNK